MGLLEVLKFPDPRLRKKSQPVKEVTQELQAFADDMLETMYEFRGIGLAAPQVNRLDRLIVIDTRPRDADSENARYESSPFTELEEKVEQPLILINPEIIEKEGSTTYDEGCLSVPTFFETVKRYEWIKLKALNREGKAIELETDGLLSICIQHEIDHLDGKLFIDRLSTIKSNRMKNKIKSQGYPEPEEPEQE